MSSILLVNAQTESSQALEDRQAVLPQAMVPQEVQNVVPQVVVPQVVVPQENLGKTRDSRRLTHKKNYEFN